jgi:hypothetical protein
MKPEAAAQLRVDVGKAGQNELVSTTCSLALQGLQGEQQPSQLALP